MKKPRNIAINNLSVCDRPITEGRAFS